DPSVSINVFPSGGVYGTPYGTPITAPGVTVRGGRRGTKPGAELVGPYSQASDTLFDILGDYARITGLRIIRPRPSTAKGQPASTGVHVGPDTYSYAPSNTTYVATIDHNEISGWPGSGVGLYGGPVDNPDQSCLTLDPRAPYNGYVSRNYIHH